MKVSFIDSGFDELLYWERENKKMINRLIKLIEDIKRNGHNGIGHSEN
jgi:toxin YoeB